MRATLDVFVEHGLDGLSMERVAARAGVGKATLYRRAGSKEELLVQAYSLVRPPGPPPDSGSLEGDLLALARGQQARVSDVGRPIISRMIAAAMSSPELHSLFMERNIKPFREILAEFIRRGIARGELRADLDIERAIDLLHGTLIHQIILDGGDPSKLPEFIPAFLPTALAGLAPNAARSSA
jgi:AcrR family transcriptional regulator